ncbi:uncharacterized protein ASPGLDRAFT_52898 [Aspergillus glaucus CBS 516.65]|uniref:Uncharacterized protein n=1 Tax=Aspergillus glaucus CBS 516.65 TaxID=1160497 RepID=A0A1L9V5D0_ASPGL|nr:hypothetical protein ASPGLDRAFT_52898 [Aspergillus glaucus CBS 516.65]OJJ79134.1 hypothetical protein ASPGLDRAFT_52898 [Aspergillus glaucus CBS 516.65]
MGQWINNHDFTADTKRKNAREASSKVEAELRRPSIFPKEVLWQPGEYGKWVELERALSRKFEDAHAHRASSLTEVLQKNIDDCYHPTPEDEKPSAEAKTAVAASITKDIVVYLLAESVQNGEAIGMRISSIREVIGSSRIKMSNDDVKRMEMAVNEKKALKDIISSELQTDIQKIDKYLSVVEPLSTLATSQKILGGIFNPDTLKIDTFPSESYNTWDKKRAHDAIKCLCAEEWITGGKDKGLIAFFDTDEKAHIFGMMFQDIEWSNDPVNLRAEKSILEAFSDNNAIDLVLEYVVPQVNDDAKAKLAVLWKRGRDLYTCGRRSLSMDLLKGL